MEPSLQSVHVKYGIVGFVEWFEMIDGGGETGVFGEVCV